MNTAIIVAAGSGSRFGGDIPKQFLELCGKQVIQHSITAFDRCRLIDEIILVVAPDRLDSSAVYLDLFSKLKSVIAGGETRAESVLEGLRRTKREGIIAVHDGARPLISDDEISKTVKAAERDGAACLVMPVTDTIKSTEDGVIIGTVERGPLRRAATPQCFRYEILARAFETEGFEHATDECSLVEKLGTRITAVEGSIRNIKITSRDDLKLARALLQ